MGRNGTAKTVHIPGLSLAEHVHALLRRQAGMETLEMYSVIGSMGEVGTTFGVVAETAPKGTIMLSMSVGVVLISAMLIQEDREIQINRAKALAREVYVLVDFGNVSFLACAVTRL